MKMLTELQELSLDEMAERARRSQMRRFGRLCKGGETVNRHERAYLREQYDRVEHRTSPRLVYAFLLVWISETVIAIIVIGMGAIR
jgi:hypothetical protein